MVCNADNILFQIFSVFPNEKNCFENFAKVCYGHYTSTFSFSSMNALDILVQSQAENSIKESSKGEYLGRCRSMTKIL